MSFNAPCRSSGGDLPFGSLTSGHGVAMEGYFWRFTDAEAGRVVTAKIGASSSNWESDGFPTSWWWGQA